MEKLSKTLLNDIMFTFVRPLFLEVGHENGQIGGVEGDRRIGAEHLIGDYLIKDLGIFDEPEYGVEEVGRKRNGDIRRPFKKLIKRQIVPLQLVVGLVGLQVLQGDINREPQYLQAIIKLRHLGSIDDQDVQNVVNSKVVLYSIAGVLRNERVDLIVQCVLDQSWHSRNDDLLQLRNDEVIKPFAFDLDTDGVGIDIDVVYLDIEPYTMRTLVASEPNSSVYLQSSDLNSQIPLLFLCDADLNLQVAIQIKANILGVDNKGMRILNLQDIGLPYDTNVLFDLTKTIVDSNTRGLLLTRDIFDLVLVDLLGDYVAVVDCDLFVDYVGGSSQHQLGLVGSVGEEEQQDG